MVVETWALQQLLQEFKFKSIKECSWRKNNEETFKVIQKSQKFMIQNQEEAKTTEGTNMNLVNNTITHL